MQVKDVQADTDAQGTNSKTQEGTHHFYKICQETKILAVQSLSPLIKMANNDLHAEPSYLNFSN